MECLVQTAISGCSCLNQIVYLSQIIHSPLTKTGNSDFTWKAWFKYSREDNVFNYSALCGRTISWIQERAWSSLVLFQTPPLIFPLLPFQAFIYTPGFTILSLNLNTLLQVIRQNCFPCYKQAQVNDFAGWGFFHQPGLRTKWWYTLSTPKRYLSECGGEILASIMSLKVHP